MQFQNKAITLKYCVKEKTDKNLEVGIDWPEGSYCIARKGGSCPPILPQFGENTNLPHSNFREGSITWNDRKSLFRRKSKNSERGVLPDGKYDKDTTINFCCRNDNAHSTPMLLPIGKPFVLYRYMGTCQNVTGTEVQEDYIKFDSKSHFSKNKCVGEHPDDDDCKEDHLIHLCYYSKAT